MLDGRTRRTTRPVAHRQHTSEGRNKPPATDPVQVTDLATGHEDEGQVDTLQISHLVRSVNPIHTQEEQYISILDAYEIAFEMAAEHAFGAAVRPEDSPSGWKEAMARPDRDKWIAAAQVEIDALLANGTWELVELPPECRAIGSRWVFLVKRRADGSIDRYKARLVARGDNQRPGIDYDQVFAPTARLGALRSILALAALDGEFIESIDILNTYLNGELEKEYEVYMHQPEGFKKSGPNGEQLVCRLMKGLYGLKQSGRLWYQKLAETLEAMGFTHTQSDPSIYVWFIDGIRVILPVFVDDITIVSKDANKISEVKNALAKVFQIKDLGQISYLLGIKVKYNQANRTLKLSQRQYIVDMLNRFKLTNCNSVTTPMDSGTQLSKALCPKSEEEREEMRNIPYMNAVGALMYLAVGTCPDIAFAVGKLAQYNSNPGRAHWQAVKHVFRYLKGTMDLKLTYQNDNDLHSAHLFITYSDSDHAGCPDTRRSTSGYVTKIGSGTVSWSSKKQSTVALSSTEAEYVATVATGKEILWMRSLLKELHYKADGTSPILVDSQSALATVMNLENHGRMKHLDIKIHWIREVVRRKQVEPFYLPTEEMTADILTKPLSRALIKRHRLSMGIM